MVVDPDRTVAELVTESPQLMAAFERLGIDYCCGGDRTLAAACERRGLHVQTTVVALEALATLPSERPAHELPAGSVIELCEHIRSAHHDLLRSELPRLDELAAAVARVHGPAEPSVGELVMTFERLGAELLEHIEQEERELFDPACGGAGVDASVLDRHQGEHDSAGRLLARLHELTGGYDLERALCRTHRRFLEGLHALERDTHQHVHEENNILFPRLREQGDARLQPCCESYVSEQAWRESRHARA